jgi:mRNA-degrading endonuclease RelE of RelBE toxin-antitoxin system
MFTVKIHRDAEKELSKAPERIRKKAFLFLAHLMEHGTQASPFPLKSLQGSFKRSKFLEGKIDKDYRIVFRREETTFYVRYAGTHNQLGTG